MNRAYIGMAFLIITLGYFLFKGVVYISLGSYLPVLFITGILALFFWGFGSSPKRFSRIIKFWSIFIILWSFIRLSLYSLDKFLKPIPEGHVYQQLNEGLPWSIAFLLMGILLLVFKKQIVELSHTKLKSK